MVERRLITTRLQLGGSGTLEGSRASSSAEGPTARERRVEEIHGARGPRESAKDQAPPSPAKQPTIISEGEGFSTVPEGLESLILPSWRPSR